MIEGPAAVRAYSEEDEPSWLRCRVLGFLGTAYFDDVLQTKPAYDTDTVELVAIVAGQVVGLIDIAARGDLATIESVAIHPDEVRRGIGTQLLRSALDRLPAHVRVLDAWTRDDRAANAWYQSNQFRETYRYLHVYASSDAEVAEAIREPRAGLVPVAGFFHARIEDEGALRSEFSRVHVCRRYERAIAQLAAAARSLATSS